jgi:lysozyme
MQTMLSPSQAAIDLIKRSEGLRFEVYEDVAGIRTAGHGHVLQPAEAWMAHVTLAIAEHWLACDVQAAGHAVNTFCTYQLTQNEFDALVDWTFNLGAERLRDSTLLKLINSGKMEEAADELLRWSFAGGRQYEGLLERRRAERALFLG